MTVGVGLTACFAEHVHMIVVDEKIDATCTEQGLTEGSHCAICGEVIVPQEIINPLGHSCVVDKGVDATCSEQGLTEGSHCAICGEVIVPQEIIPKENHKIWHQSLDSIYSMYCIECGYKSFPVIRISSDDAFSKEYVDAKVCVESGYNYYDFEDADCQIKIRGNGTATYDKKPYRLKFKKSK